MKRRTLQIVKTDRRNAGCYDLSERHHFTLFDLLAQLLGVFVCMALFYGALILFWSL